MQNPNIIAHRSNVPNAVIETYVRHPVRDRKHFIPVLPSGPIIGLLTNEDVDPFILTMRMASFFERYNGVTFQLKAKNSDYLLTQIMTPCYIRKEEFPQLKTLNYSGVTKEPFETEINACNYTTWYPIERVSRNQIQVLIPWGNLRPFIPTSAANDKLYFHRTFSKNYGTEQKWIVLEVLVGNKLTRPRPTAFVIDQDISYLTDHKFLFLPPSLRTRHSMFSYYTNGICYYNSTFTTSPVSPQYPGGIVMNPVRLVTWWCTQTSKCTPSYLKAKIFPYGKLELALLQVEKPKNRLELCAFLPNADNTLTSYERLYRTIMNKLNQQLKWFMAGKRKS